jgi:hypothetical protein
VDVFGVAESLGIPVRKADTTQFEGKFSWDGSAEFIDLAEVGSSYRRRFTLAHEIGHWLLRQFESRRGTSGSGERFRNASTKKPTVGEEEQLANIIAAEILMPLDAFRADMTFRELTWSAVRALSHKYRVSNLAVLRRAADLSGKIIACVTVVPNRFSDLSSTAIADSVFFLVPGKGFVQEVGSVELPERNPFQELVARRNARVSVITSRGRTTANWDLKLHREPMPHAKLLAAGLIFRPVLRNANSQEMMEH